MLAFSTKYFDKWSKSGTENDKITISRLIILVSNSTNLAQNCHKSHWNMLLYILNWWKRTKKREREKKKKICHWQDSNPYPERWKNMTPLPARPRRLHMKYVKNCSTDLNGPRDFPVCILKSFTFLKLPFNYLSFGTIFISQYFCFRLLCVLDLRVT